MEQRVGGLDYCRLAFVRVSFSLFVLVLVSLSLSLGARVCDL